MPSLRFNMEKKSRIYIAGHNGLAGSAIVRELQKQGYSHLLMKTHAELDLLDANQVHHFFEQEKPEYVFLAAAKVGGILANSTFPADFIYQNLLIQTHVIHASFLNQVKKLLFLGSSCIYPREASQPIHEEYLMSGKLEKTNSAYAMAKLAGIEMCRAYFRQHGSKFISVMPTNLYGTGDNYDLKNSHVLPALIRRFHEAKREHQKSITLWGTGTPRREFLHADDLGSALVFLMQKYDRPDQIINVGVGEDIQIIDLAQSIASIVGFEGEILWNTQMPDGTYQKLLEVSKLFGMGWRPKISLDQGLRQTYQDFLNSKWAVL